MERDEFARIAALAGQLPAESRTVRAIEPRAQWSEEAYLLALIADNISFQRFEQRGGKGQRPKPIERPHAPAAKPCGGVEPARMRELLFGRRKAVR